MTNRRNTILKQAPLALTVALTLSVAAGCGDKSNSTATTEAVAGETNGKAVLATDTGPAEVALTAPAEPARSNANAGNEGTVDEGQTDEGQQDDGSTVDPDVPSNSAVGVNVNETPGQSEDNFVGAASDVKQQTCEADGDSWKATGTVTNSSGKDAKYRIYVAFNEAGTTNTKALAQVNKDVADGATESWSVEAKTEGSLICILRVERTSA